MALLPVQKALERIVDGVTPVDVEHVALTDALGRILAEGLASCRTQPPWDTSAMDGYAVRAADITGVPARLNLIGTAAAGHGFKGTLGPGEAVRIFTGAPLPDGADAIVIQEDADLDDTEVVVREAVATGRHVRKRGLDFTEGEVLFNAGRRLRPRDLSLAAAMDWPRLPVRRLPTVAILATGDELVSPGETAGPYQIVSSNDIGLAGIVARAGGTAVRLGIAPDREDAISALARQAVDVHADVLVTLGGASVGEHDLVQAALLAEGMTLDFWRIAMRPGKPLMFGRLGRTRVLGLPGNPVSALVCARLFLIPLMNALLGRSPEEDGEEPARLGADVKANDQRQDYLRARLSRDGAGTLVATPFPTQDSAMLANLARADALIVRAPHAPAARAGAPCRILRLDF